MPTAQVYKPYLLINKKRYAGLLYTNPDKPDKMDAKVSSLLAKDHNIMRVLPILLHESHGLAGWKRWCACRAQGIETVRRDNCQLVRTVVSTCMDKILVGEDELGAQAYVRATISDLLMNRLDLSLLVITKASASPVLHRRPCCRMVLMQGQPNHDGREQCRHGRGVVRAQALTKDDTAYKAQQAHVELAKKMRKRDPATAPTIGDRVAYVIIKARPPQRMPASYKALQTAWGLGRHSRCPHAQGAKGMKTYEKAEDPIFALEHNLPIDFQHYLDHHLELPLKRLFEPMMRDPKELMSGAYAAHHAL